MKQPDLNCIRNCRLTITTFGLLALLLVLGKLTGHGVFSTNAAELQSFTNADAKERQFEAKGEITWYFGNAYKEHENNEERTTRFKIRVDGCNWLITSESTSTGLPGTLQIGSDSTNIYISEVFAADQISPSPDQDTNSFAWKAKVEEIKKGRIPMPAKVLPGVLPRFDFKDSQWIWLSFASSCFFHKHATNRLPLTFLIFSPYVPEDTGAVQWTWHNADQNLLDSFVWFDEGFVNRGQGKPRWEWPPPFERGFTNFHYQVKRVARFDDILLPAEFRMTLYSPQLGSTNWLGVSRWAIGKIETVKRLSLRHESGRPPLDRLTQVSDHRGGPAFGAGVVKYNTRSEWWQTNENRFAKAVQGIYDEESRPPLAITAAIALLVLACIYPAGAWIVSRRVKKTTTQ